MNDVSLESRLVAKLKTLGYHISAAESVSGGLLAARITSVPGASDVFSEGFVTYSTEAKIKHLSVKPSIIERHGIVSVDVARAMVEGLFKATKAEVCVALTGYAGPSGGDVTHPLGTVCFGYAILGFVSNEAVLFQGDRESIRSQAVQHALNHLLSLLEGSHESST